MEGATDKRTPESPHRAVPRTAVCTSRDASTRVSRWAGLSHLEMGGPGTAHPQHTVARRPLAALVYHLGPTCAGRRLAV
eukprot:2982614-Prymnesium_polylepis.1